MVGGGEPLHVRADLGDEDLRCPLPDTWDGVQPRHGRGERLGSGGDLGADLRDALIQEVKLSEVLRLQEALVRSEAANQRPLQLRDLLTQPPFGQCGELGRLGLPSDQGPQDSPARLAGDIGDDRG